jgi:hypothetical protein
MFHFPHLWFPNNFQGRLWQLNLSRKGLPRIWPELAIKEGLVIQVMCDWTSTGVMLEAVWRRDLAPNLAMDSLFGVYICGDRGHARGKPMLYRGHCVLLLNFATLRSGVGGKDSLFKALMRGHQRCVSWELA